MLAKGIELHAFLAKLFLVKTDQIIFSKSKQIVKFSEELPKSQKLFWVNCEILWACPKVAPTDK